MNDSINNRLAFNIYVWINFCLTISVIGYCIIPVAQVLGGYKILGHDAVIYLLIGPVIWSLVWGFDTLIKPSFFEAKINYEQINIKTFNPNTRNGFRFFLMLLYKKYLMDVRIDRQSYNSYRILIEKFGFKKSLILQKTENGKLYESKSINISFLGAKKYTELILSIDRIKEKISLN